MGTNRWEVMDGAGRTHVVSVDKRLFGTRTLHVDGHQLMRLGGDGIVAFEVAGRPARPGASWPFAFGVIAYALDLLLVLSLTDWIGVAIHGFALMTFLSGWRAARALRSVSSSRPSAAAA